MYKCNLEICLEKTLDINFEDLSIRLLITTRGLDVFFLTEGLNFFLTVPMKLGYNPSDSPQELTTLTTGPPCQTFI